MSAIPYHNFNISIYSLRISYFCHIVSSNSSYIFSISSQLYIFVLNRKKQNNNKNIESILCWPNIPKQGTCAGARHCIGERFSLPQEASVVKGFVVRGRTLCPLGFSTLGCCWFETVPVLRVLPWPL